MKKWGEILLDLDIPLHFSSMIFCDLHQDPFAALAIHFFSYLSCHLLLHFMHSIIHLVDALQLNQRFDVPKKDISCLDTFGSNNATTVELLLFFSRKDTVPLIFSELLDLYFIVTILIIKEQFFFSCVRDEKETNKKVSRVSKLGTRWFSFFPILLIDRHY